MKILIAGDFCQNDRIANILTTQDKNAILCDIESVVKKCDLSIVNLECPIPKENRLPIEKEGPNLKSTSEALRLLKQCGFSMTTLANNHIRDYGADGVLDTIELLDNAGIGHVGAGSNIKEATNTYYYTKNEQTIAIINCCEHEFSIATETSAGANPLNPIQQWYAIKDAKHHADYVIMIVHGGHEHYSLPSPRMQETYRFFVDAGVDIVVNHHQHCYSGYEIYNGKPIFYGLGNFCFDWEGKRDSKWNYGYLVELDIDKTIDFTLYPYEQCNTRAEVKLLQGNEKLNFENDIARLNTIIASPKDLKKEHKKWIEEDERNWLILFTPFTNRYIQAMIRRKLLPLYIPKKKIITLLNRIMCESHRDKIAHILGKQL
ncbi:MAG: CapA family protein [Paludibacteraceae bacterium]|nr:CapA family protein [Paludibacteraceae bacterium]